MTDSKTPPKYDVAIVETAVLEMAVELHPQHLSFSDLLLKIVGDPDDSKEVEVATRAISNLRKSGQFSDRDAEKVELTQATLQTVALLTRSL